MVEVEDRSRCFASMWTFKQPPGKIATEYPAFLTNSVSGPFPSPHHCGGVWMNTNSRQGGEVTQCVGESKHNAREQWWSPCNRHQVASLPAPFALQPFVNPDLHTHQNLATQMTAKTPSCDLDFGAFHSPPVFMCLCLLLGCYMKGGPGDDDVYYRAWRWVGVPAASLSWAAETLTMSRLGTQLLWTVCAYESCVSLQIWGYVCHVKENAISDGSSTVVLYVDGWNGSPEQVTVQKNKKCDTR